MMVLRNEACKRPESASKNPRRKETTATAREAAFILFEKARISVCVLFVVRREVRAVRCIFARAVGTGSAILYIEEK